MTEPNAAPPAPKKTVIPWLGNLYGALDFSRPAPAPIEPTKNAPPAPAAPAVPPVVTKIQEAATPFAPVTVHVHNGKPKPKGKPKAEGEAK